MQYGYCKGARSIDGQEGAWAWTDKEKGELMISTY